MPFAKGVHQLSRAIAAEVEQNPNVKDSIKSKVREGSNFADLGMTRLTEIQDSGRRVADKLGLA